MLVKVCGMRSSDNIRQVELAGPDIMGFIFHPASPRFVAELPEYMPLRCLRAGVFVHSDTDSILRTAEAFGLHIVQLHGEGSPELCRRLRGHGLKVIRALGVSSREDLKAAANFEGACDYLLLDTACARHGGSGRMFDWDILESYTGGIPFFLSGGIGPDSAKRIGEVRHPLLCGVDINSRFETAAAVKDAAAVEKFIKEIKQISRI